ncbi:hypothetical protein GGR50DRAFT_686892 [Xylaria sp. CBS 124048]|nr:hypothetical protein GGR50DRAFT_686892 [Xylaria sp. CBS 124048]
MATTSSPPQANSAHAPTIGAGNPASAGAPPLAESPSIIPSSPSVPGAATNGAASNGPSSSFLVGPLDESPGSEMRIYPRDGRVRNPVPSKLKNVNDQMKGNFGVMHMDVASHRASEGRDAAAKRTSESTALQAKLAQTDTYVSHQRRANYPRPPGLKQFNADKGVSVKKTAEPALNTGPPRPLTVAETKTEQARLLTLLRSLPHHTVVDQICKGLAFFGGIPDAPPPSDGKFPESAEANGSGSLFVGWIAEIFPDLENPRPRHVEDPAAQTTGQKRPRGRPKGSKASKARSDKGLKKGPQKAHKGGADQTQNPQDDSGWVDVEDSVLELNDNGDLVETTEALRDAPTTPSTGLNGGGIPNATPATGSTAGFRSINDIGLATGSNAKKRGRPKGSKNRPKDKASQSIPPPIVTPVPVPLPMLDAQPKNSGSSAKPKPTKSRPMPAAESANSIAAGNTEQQGFTDPNGPSDLASAQAPTAAAALSFANEFATSAANGAPTHNQDGYLAAQGTTSALPSPVNQVKASTVTAKKRKRPATTESEGTASLGGAPSGSQNAQPNAIQTSQSTQLQNPAGQAAHRLTPINAAIPQPKRVRKSQESLASSTVRRPTPTNIGQKTPIPTAPVVTEPEHQPASGDAVQSHPPAEGLEAHYAAMQSHTDQMQSYNSRPQHKQPTHSASSMGSTVSPVPAAAPAPAGGLDAHLEHFTALQNMSDTSRPAAAGRSKQQPTQTASPIPAQPSKLPQMSATLSQHRASQSYYSQGTGLGSSYNSQQQQQQQQSYSTAQRSQQHLSSSPSSTGLVQHVTNSPQFSAQSNSPLMQTDTNYRGSPSLIHSNATFARRTPSASPLDNSTYRPTNATNHGVTNHSPHFGARQASATATTHNTSHSGLPSTFPTFSDTALFDMSIDSSASHSNLGIGNSSYGLNSAAVSQQQRSSSSNTTSLYSPSGMGSGYLGPPSIGRTGQQNRWTS